MHWLTREKTTEKLRFEITESQHKLSNLLERSILGKEDPIEIYRYRSLLQARLNNAKTDLESWLDTPRSFEV